MNILALEFSSPGASVALLRGSNILGEYAWQDKRLASQPLFEHVPALMKEHGLSFAGLDYIAVGRGPGNYSGLRVSLAVAQALCLPHDSQVYAVSSGEALAGALARETEFNSLAVVGDARRHACWYGIFEKKNTGLAQTRAWSLCPLAELPSRLSHDTWVVSPDYSRLTAQPYFDPAKQLHWLPGDRFPTAVSVGRCVLDRIERGLDAESPQPLYMHPAVAAKS